MEDVKGSSVQGVNYPRRKLSGFNYLGTIFLGANCLRDNCPGVIVWGAIILGGNCPMRQLSEDKCPEGNC